MKSEQELILALQALALSVLCKGLLQTASPEESQTILGSDLGRTVSWVGGGVEGRGPCLKICERWAMTQTLWVLHVCQKNESETQVWLHYTASKVLHTYEYYKHERDSLNYLSQLISPRPLPLSHLHDFYSEISNFCFLNVTLLLYSFKKLSFLNFSCKQKAKITVFKVLSLSAGP